MSNQAGPLDAPNAIRRTRASLSGASARTGCRARTTTLSPAPRGQQGERAPPIGLDAISRADWVADLVTVIDQLRAEVKSHTSIGLIGASFGAYLSVLAARERPVHCLSLRVPADYRDEGYDDPLVPQLSALGEHGRWPNLAALPTLAVRGLRAFAGPVQIIDAERDEAVPPWVTAAYVAAVPAARLTRAPLREAPHQLSTPQLRAQYLRLLTGWVKDLVA